ncbi:MAG: tetratricopeptide repeat protein [Actinomycetota bacterium]
MSGNRKWLLLIPLFIAVVALAYIIPKVFGGDSGDKDSTVKQSQAIETEVADLQLQIDAYGEMLKRNPNDLMALRGLGDMYLQKGFVESEGGDLSQPARSYKAAVDNYRRYLAIKPDDVELRIDLGLAYSYLEMIDIAVRELGAATAVASANQRAWHSLGWVLSSAGRTSEARDAWQKSYTIDPNSAIGKESKQFLDETAGMGLATTPAP